MTTPNQEEIARLRACLEKANNQAEHFEREWYLRGDELARLRAQEPEDWHNPVATAVRDSMTGQVQLEYIGHFPADELVRLYAAPQPHHIDLVNVAVAVRDACHQAWVTSAENWRSDIDVRKIVADTSPQPAQPAEPVQPGWRDIESAPKDELILVGPTKRMGICVAMHDSRDGWVTETCSEWMTIYTPTHWMPLPAPPKEAT